MRRSVLARCAAVAVLAALGSLVPPVNGQEAKPTGGTAAPTKPELSPDELYNAKRPEVMAQIAARLESAAGFAWSSDLKQTAVELFKKVLEIDPENRKARESLGWERKDGAWVANEKKQKATEGFTDSSKGEKKRGEYEKKLRDAEVAAAKLLADLGELAFKAGDEDAAKALWKQALAHDDQNPFANERSGNKKVDGKWFTGRALAHKEFEKVYNTSLKRAQELAVAPVTCDETSGFFEAAKIEKFKRYRTKNFRIESTLSDDDIRQTLTWLERARQFFLELYQVPERLVDYSSAPAVFVIGKDDAEHHRLIDACTAIPEKDKSFQKKFGWNQLGGKVTLGTAPNAETAQSIGIHAATHWFAVDAFGQHAPWLYEALANSVSAAIKRADLVVCFSGKGSTAGTQLERISLSEAPGLLRDSILSGKDPPLSEFVRLPADGMSARHIAKAWSIVMFLLEKDRSQAREYFAAAAQGSGGEASKDDRVLAQFFGDLPKWKDLDAVWREWAVDVYKP